MLVALTFIFSGFVKAVDPLGTQYKIADYLTALGIAHVPDWLTLGSAVGLAALEFTLGVLLLFAIQRRLVSRVIFVFLCLMTLVTLWIFIANPVSDCGCFGDAIHLTNGQTLLKNVILLACAYVVMRKPMEMFRFVSESNQWIAIHWTLFFVLALSVYCLYKLPVLDFRPYRVGTNLIKSMEIPEGAEAPQFETTFILQKDGKQQEFTLDNYPDSTWEFVDSKTVQTKAGYVPPIHDLVIEDRTSGEDVTQSLLGAKGYTFLLVSPHLEKASDANFGDIDRIYEYAQAENVPFYCVTASGDDAIGQWQERTGAEYPFLTADETALKTAIRSNPGLILLKDSTVVRKWSHNALPKADIMTSPISKAVIGQRDASTLSGTLLRLACWFAIPLLLLIIADRLWQWTKWVRCKKKEKN